jgi:hypothetical protein
MSRLAAVRRIVAGLSLLERTQLADGINAEFALLQVGAAEPPVAELVAEHARAAIADLRRLGATDPAAAGVIASAMWSALIAHRPASPAPLDAGFLPTEPVPTEAPGAQ